MGSLNGHEKDMIKTWFRHESKAKATDFAYEKVQVFYDL
jgi:hypothetical protein